MGVYVKRDEICVVISKSNFIGSDICSQIDCPIHRALKEVLNEGVSINVYSDGIVLDNRIYISSSNIREFHNIFNNLHVNEVEFILDESHFRLAGIYYRTIYLKHAGIWGLVNEGKYRRKWLVRVLARAYKYMLNLL